MEQNKQLTAILTKMDEVENLSNAEIMLEISRRKLDIIAMEEVLGNRHLARENKSLIELPVDGSVALNRFDLSNSVILAAADKNTIVEVEMEGYNTLVAKRGCSKSIRSYFIVGSPSFKMKCITTIDGVETIKTVYANFDNKAGYVLTDKES